MDGKVFICRQSRHFSFVGIMIKVLFPICTWTWRVNKYVSHQGRGINRNSESTIIGKRLNIVGVTTFCQLTVNKCNLSFF